MTTRFMRRLERLEKVTEAGPRLGLVDLLQRLNASEGTGEPSRNRALSSEGLVATPERAGGLVATLAGIGRRRRGCPPSPADPRPLSSELGRHPHDCRAPIPAWAGRL